MPIRELDNPKCKKCLNSGAKQTICLKEIDKLCYEKDFQLKYIKSKK